MQRALFHNKNKHQTGFHPTNILWLGDSITYGYNGGYSNKFYLLVSSHFGCSYTMIGSPGAVMDPDLYGLPNAGNSLKYYQKPLTNTGNFGAGNYVIMQFGTNDYGPFDHFWKDSYKTIVSAIIAYGYTAGQIIMSTEPYQTARPYGPQARDYASQIASELGTKFYNAWDYTYANGGNSLIDTDGIHPTSTGHIVYATGLINYLENL